MKIVRRTQMGAAFALLAALFALLAMASPVPQLVTSSSTAPVNAKIFVDSDVRVTYDGDVPHMEAYIGASATDRDFLFAGGELAIPGRNSTATEARLYISTSAGALWTPVPLPNEVNGGWDNAVVGGTGGVAYFLTSNRERGFTLYRTDDFGKNWMFTVLAEAKNWDRPHITLDYTDGPKRGRLYVAAEAEDGVRVLSSADGARTFSPSVLACPHAPKWNAATDASPMVLSDGTLIVPCSPYPNDPIRLTWTDAEVGLVSSHDGGRTFTPYHRIAIVHRLPEQAMYIARARGDLFLSGNFMSGPSFAAAPTGTPFPDRLYAVWQDIGAAGNSRLLLSWSPDQGATWSPPKTVSSPTSKIWRQGVPMVAVNREGILGVAWFDGRLAPHKSGYDVYFTASLDGGLSFLPARRVSTATSIPARGQNIIPAVNVSKPSSTDDIDVDLSSAYSERATGADYSTMAVDAAGRFHPLWPDARSNAWQLYTAAVHVLTGESLAHLDSPLPPSDVPSTSAPDCPDASSALQPIFGEAEWNSAAHEFSIPVRFFNTSRNSISTLIRVRAAVKPRTDGWAQFIPPAAYLRPRIFDPQDKTFADGATFTYLPSPSAPLFPGSVTSPQNWRVQVAPPYNLDFSFQVHAAFSCAGKETPVSMSPKRGTSPVH